MFLREYIYMLLLFQEKVSILRNSILRNNIFFQYKPCNLWGVIIEIYTVNIKNQNSVSTNELIDKLSHIFELCACVCVCICVCKIDR